MQHGRGRLADLTIEDVLAAAQAFQIYRTRSALVNQDSYKILKSCKDVGLDRDALKEANRVTRAGYSSLVALRLLSADSDSCSEGDLVVYAFLLEMQKANHRELRKLQSENAKLFTLYKKRGLHRHLIQEVANRIKRIKIEYDTPEATQIAADTVMDYLEGKD